MNDKERRKGMNCENYVNIYRMLDIVNETDVHEKGMIEHYI